jgi:glycine reductase
VCTIVPISKTVGANRIVPAVAIPHPLGDPARSAEEERLLRLRLVERALEALETEISEQTVFE